MMKTNIYIFKPLFGFGFANHNFIFKIPLLLFANVNVAFPNFFGMPAVSSALSYSINTPDSRIDCAEELKNRS